MGQRVVPCRRSGPDADVAEGPSLAHRDVDLLCDDCRFSGIIAGIGRRALKQVLALAHLRP